MVEKTSYMEAHLRNIRKIMLFKIIIITNRQKLYHKLIKIKIKNLNVMKGYGKMS